MGYGKEANTVSIMYKLMGAMSNLGYPIVFKGAMVLNTLTGKTRLNTQRMTEDIDGDWVSPEITNEKLLNNLQFAITTLGIPHLYVEQTRVYGERKSAGFAVKSKQDEETLFTLDIGIKSNNYYVSYSQEGIAFYGSHPSKIYADKISAISTPRIYRRTKDIYDMFLLSFLDSTFTTQDITEVLSSSGVSLGDFSNFLNDTKPKGVEYAYNKLDGITNKPDYIVVHKRVETFIEPFTKTNTPPKGFWSVDSHTGQGYWILM